MIIHTLSANNFYIDMTQEYAKRTLINKNIQYEHLKYNKLNSDIEFFYYNKGYFIKQRLSFMNGACVDIIDMLKIGKGNLSNKLKNFKIIKKKKGEWIIEVNYETYKIFISESTKKIIKIEPVIKTT
ncbi:MAG: hypothetical protein WCX82_03520 [archaeon]